MRGRGGVVSKGVPVKISPSLVRGREEKREGRRNRLLRAPFDSIDPPC